MRIGICLQFSIRRHAQRIGAFRKCERIGRGFAKRLAGSGSPPFERWRSPRAANLQPRCEIGAKPETVRYLRGLLLSAACRRSAERWPKTHSLPNGGAFTTHPTRTLGSRTQRGEIRNEHSTDAELSPARGPIVEKGHIDPAMN